MYILLEEVSGKGFIPSLEHELPDSELVTQVKKGYRPAFDQLFKRYGRRILTYVYRYTGQYQRAEELTQEVFLKAFKHIDSYREKGKFSAWLYTIAGNIVKNELRSRKTAFLVSMDAPVGEGEEITLGEKIADQASGPVTPLQEDEQQRALAGLLQRLKPKYRELVILCDIQEVPYEDAARIVGCSVGTVGSRLSRARRQLGLMWEHTKLQKP